MTFLDIEFAFFLPLFLILYFVVPKKYRYVVTLVGSYVFYAFADIRLALVLLGVTILTYVGGFVIGKNKRKSLLALFFTLNILVLVFFKYTNFIISDLGSVVSRINPGFTGFNELSIILPAGLSFMIFQSSTYLTDVYKDKIKPTKNFVLYAAFVAFFPCIICGPIQKSRELIPQLIEPKSVTGDDFKKGTLLFAWGFCEKVLVANRLSTIINPVFADCVNVNPALNLLAAVLFSVYIYADFASYSDMARGVALFMGIDVGKNFDNPYLSRSTSEFWNRWHMSLNSWFLENIYIPLGGNRKGEFRKYLNIMVVFFVSGIWHGAGNHFIVWGVLNGLLVILGRMLLPLKDKVYARLKINPEVEGIVFLERLWVFILITFTWIFFNNGFMQSVEIIRSIAHVKLLDFFRDDFVGVAGGVRTTVSLIIALYAFYKIQVKRVDEKKFYEKFNNQPMILQAIILAIIIYLCVFAVCGTDKFVNTTFLYAQF